MPDQPSPRRRFQFRLRTLLIVVTAAAVLCCIVADRMRLVRERDEWKERALNRAEAMAWMERTRQAELELSDIKARLDASRRP